MKHHLATIGMGSNVGPREEILRAAIAEVTGQRDTRLLRCSSLYETEPFGRKDQGWFLNCVIQVETVMEVKGFFGGLQHTEFRFGRDRCQKWGPRTLDMDLLFFDMLVIEEPDLQIPHPGIPFRRFVLEPLCEIAQDLVHPVLGSRMEELLRQVQDPGLVIKRKGPFLHPDVW